MKTVIFLFVFSFLFTSNLISQNFEGSNLNSNEVQSLTSRVKIVRDSFVLDPVAAIKLADGKYLICIQATNRFETYQVTNVLIKCDENGSIVWNKALKNISTYNAIYYSGITEGADNSIVLAGRVINNDGTIETAATVDMIVTKIDGSGNVIWTKLFNPNYSLSSIGEEQFGLLHLTIDAVTKDIYVAGLIYYQNKNFIIKLDLNGEAKWSKVFDTNYGIADPIGVDVTSAGLYLFNVVILPSEPFAIQSILGGLSLSKEDGEVISSKYWKTNENNHMIDLTTFDVKRNNAGGYYIYGKCYDNGLIDINTSKSFFQVSVVELTPSLNFSKAYAYSTSKPSSNNFVDIDGNGRGVFSMKTYPASRYNDIVEFNGSEILAIKSLDLFNAEGAGPVSNDFCFVNPGNYLVFHTIDPFIEDRALGVLKFDSLNFRNKNACLEKSNSRSQVKLVNYVQTPVQVILASDTAFTEIGELSVEFEPFATSLSIVCESNSGDEDDDGDDCEEDKKVEILESSGDNINLKNSKVQPNPFTDKFTIQLGSETSEKVFITISSMNGGVIRKEMKFVEKGLNFIKIENLDRLSRGAFILTVFSDDNKLLLRQIITK